MIAKLLPLIPPHRTYVEPFGGGASLLVAREPSAVEVYNDLNSGLVNFFRVLRDPEQFAELHRLALLTPYAREEFDLYNKTWAEAATPVERAYRWFTVARMSFSGSFGVSWAKAVTTTTRGMSNKCSTWLSTVELLPKISARLLRVQIEHTDAFKVIEGYDTPETFFYLDPPYVFSTRSSGGYEHELSDDQHRRLVELLLKVKAKVMLSGYANPIYAELEARGWHRKDWQTACHAVLKTKRTGMVGAGAARLKQQRVESVWCNYEIDDKELALAP